MKKIIFLLFPLLTLAQNPTNFPYGIKNPAATSDNTPAYFTTTQVDGVHKKTPAALVAKVAIVNDSLATKENVANKSDSYTSSSSTTYASTKAVVDGLATKISGTGTTNYLPKFTSANVLGNSQIIDNGTNVNIGLPSIIKGTVATDSAPLGSELTTTGTGTNWTGTNFDTGYAHTIGSTAALTTTLAATLNSLYQIAYTITGRTTGSVIISYGGYVSGAITATGAVGPKATTTDLLTITPTTDFNGTIVLSIKTISSASSVLRLNDSSNNTAFEVKAHRISNNVSVGLNAGNSITTGYDNTLYGSSAGSSITTGINNVAIGSQALPKIQYSNSNAAVGRTSLYSLLVGDSNTAVGQSTGYYLTSGNTNTLIGNFAGVVLGVGGNMTSSTNAILIGNTVKALDNGQTNQIVIGNSTTGLGSNSTVLGNSSTTKTAIYGNLLLGTTTDNGVDKLQVNGTVSATSYTGNATLTGTPTAPTATAGTNTTQIATTAFVQNGFVSLTGNQTIAGVKTFASSPLIGTGSLSFTDTDLFGDIMTIYANANKWQFSNTVGGKLLDFTNSAISFYKTNGIKADILSDLLTASRNYSLPDASGTLALTSDLTTKAPLSSPTFTGTPTAPTATVGTNTTQIATTAFVQETKKITVRKVSTNITLADSDNATVILLTASATITLPNGLMNGFNASFATQTGATLTYSLGGSVVLINNALTSMPELSSHTIVNTGVANEYLTVGL